MVLTEGAADKVYQFIHELIYGDMLDKRVNPFIDMMEQMKENLGTE